LDVDGGIVRTERDVQAHLDPVLAGHLVTESETSGRNRLGSLEAFEVVPRRAAAGEADEAEAPPELPVLRRRNFDGAAVVSRGSAMVICAAAVDPPSTTAIRTPIT
jgi:hypothetical protein